MACDLAPAADGGEGTLDVLGGTVRVTTVRGPLGDPVEAEWRMQVAGSEWGPGPERPHEREIRPERPHEREIRPEATAVIEMARASGLSLVGGAEGNDALRATTAGTGELLAAALDAGARRVIVGAGGSATTDGGLAAITALQSRRRLHAGIELIVACDVDTLFVDAAQVFAPQKGATPAQVSLLHRRLERLVQVYVRDYGVDVSRLPGSGAAGGLAGGLAAIGATLVPGFDVVADALSLAARIGLADLVVTGEGLLDAESFEGKVVGGVLRLAAAAGVPALVVVGDVVEEELPELPPSVTLVSLVGRFGERRAMADVTGCVEEIVAGYLR